MLTRVPPQLESCYVVRVRRADILEAAVDVDGSQLGETGVVFVDFSHRNLMADRPLMYALFRVVLRRLREGQDRVRKLSRLQPQNVLDWLLSLGPEGRPTHT